MARTGQFVDGSWWVAPDVDNGTVTVDSKSPAWDGTRHGTMIDPVPSGGTNAFPPEASAKQGFDTRSRKGSLLTYNSALNAEYPIIIDTSVAPITSIVGTQTSTSTSTSELNAVKYASVLTVLNTPPAADAFRPHPYGGYPKTIYTKSQVNYALLPALAFPSGISTSNLAHLDDGDHLTRPSIEIGPVVWIQRTYPLSQGGSYGEQHSKFMTQTLMAALLNWERAEEMADRGIQRGIDNRGAFGNGSALWQYADGHSHGRKLPIIWAGTLLNEPSMLNLLMDGGAVDGRGNAYRYFAEDNMLDPGDDPLAPRGFAAGEYPFWCDGFGTTKSRKSQEEHTETTGYRSQTGGYWVPMELILTVMGMKAGWNYPLFSSYVRDIWLGIRTVYHGGVTEGSALHQRDKLIYGGWGTISPYFTGGFATKMWEAYNDYVPV